MTARKDYILPLKTLKCHEMSYETIKATIGHNAMLSRMRPHIAMTVKSNKTIQGHIRPCKTTQGQTRPEKAIQVKHDNSTP